MQTCTSEIDGYPDGVESQSQIDKQFEIELKLWI